MKHHQLPYEDALKLVREKRRIVNPNHAFVSQLLLLQDSRFDLSHLGPELLAQAIDNPYDPDEFPEETARRERRREEKRREKELEEATKRKLELEEEGRWVSILFASAKDRQSWEECMRVVRGDEMEVDEKEAEAGAEHAAAPGSQASPATPVPEAAESTPRTGTPPVGQDLSTPPTVVSTAPTTLPAVPDTEALDDTDMAMV